MKNSIKLSSLVLGLLIASCSSSEVPAEDPIDPSTKITYEKDVKSIINSSCATAACHDNVSPTAGLSLTTYDLVRNAAENGNLFGRINSTTNFMPPTGQLPSPTRSIITKWKDDGYLEQ